MKSHLWISDRSDSPSELRSEAFEVWAYTHPSPHHPDRNEDAAGVWLMDDGRALLAVSDGMGGTPQGADASAAAIRALDAEVTRSESSGSLRAAILDAFERANQVILEDIAGSGSTLVVGELVAGEARTYNVGDSAALLMGQRGKMKLETIAHSPVGYGIAAGLIDPDAALSHEDRHYLSNHLGSRSMHVEVGSACTLAARDTFLVASDGLLDNMSPTEIVSVVRKGPLRDAAARMVETCHSRMAGGEAGDLGKPDDLTFLLARRIVS